MDDNLSLDVTKGLNFEARVLLSVMPSAAGVQAVWGVGSVWIDGPNNNTCFLRFGATANGAVLIQAFDGVTTTSIGDRSHGRHHGLAYLPDRREQR